MISLAADHPAVRAAREAMGGAPEGARIVVAMSGGVDSSVVAALVKGAGYDAVGVTMQLYDHGAGAHRKGACCAGQDVADARAVADALGIPHYVLDYEERFRDRVIEPFAAAYAAGETPVPCISCNQSIKFADLLDTAGDLGAHALATGHYVASRSDGAGGRALVRAADASRDQSYFLFATTKPQLERLRFPLGDLPKAQVREVAREIGLSVAEKVDSQDICFVPAGDYADVVEKLKPEAARPGEIVHVDGRALGRHEGVIRYTVGQRRGIGVSTGEPLYVVRLDAATARVVVGPREALGVKRLRLREMNWLGAGALDALPPGGVEVAARVRSTRPPAPARLFADGIVELLEGETGVAPGQACALYSDAGPRARVLGGGFIEATADDAGRAAA